MIYTIKVKDYDSMQNITVGLAKNGYYVTTENVTDENYKSHWEIKYCESSEINKIPVNNGSDWDGDFLGSMEIHNKDNTKGVKCKNIPDEKPSVVNENDPDFKPVSFDEKGNIIKNDEKPLVEKDKVDTKSKSKHKSNSYGLMLRDKTPDVPPIPQQDVSDIITDEPMTIITSVSGN